MPRKSRKNVGLIGLGIIGTRVANALRSGGWHVYVWNRSPRAVPNFLPSPRQVAEFCDIIQLFVADARALFDVLDAMGDALTPQHTFICSATVGPEATLEAAKIVQERGALFLDAPFTGSKEAAESKQLVYYIGGEEEALNRARPVLEASAKAIIKIGKVGDAAVVKVATNMIAAVTVQTLGEAYAIVKASGVDAKALREALDNNGIRSATADVKLGKILNQDYEPHFSLKHMFKDVQLGIHIANALDIDLPATTATAGVMYGGLTRGWADQDFSVLARVYQKDEEPPKKEEPASAAPGPAVAAAPEVAPPAPPAENPPAPVAAVEAKPPEEPKETLSPEELKAIGAEPAPKEAVPTVNGTQAADRVPFIRRWFGAGTPG